MENKDKKKMSNFMRLPNWLSGRQTKATPATDDPFAHPAIQAMSLRELADLPFPRASEQRKPVRRT